MKTFSTFILAAAIAGTSAVARGGEISEAQWSACAAEVQAYYGTDTDVSLVERRRNPHGTRLRVAARTDTDNAKFATCWVPGHSEVEFVDGGESYQLDEENQLIVSR